MDNAAVILTSDWHRGSILAAWSENVLLPNGSRWTPNVVQEWLDEKADEFWRYARDLAKKRRTIVIVDGDIIEGVHHNARELITLNKEYHRRCALEEIKKRKFRGDSWVFVRGTPVHDGFEGEDMETVAHEAGCQQLASGMYSYQTLRLSVNGIIFNVAHHIGTTSSPGGEASALTTQLVKAARDVGMWGTEMPDIIVRAHRHRAARVWLPGTGQGRLVLTTPSWIARGEHGSKVDPTSPPQVGGAVILIDKDKTWQPFFKDWSLPQEEMTVL